MGIQIEGTLDARCAVKVLLWIAVVGMLVAWEPWQRLNAQGETERRVTVLETVRSDARLTAIETRLSDYDRRFDAIESTARSILIGVCSQLIVLIIIWRQRKPEA